MFGLHFALMKEKEKMQIIIVFIILSLSLCYIGYRVYKSFSGGGDPCKGCNGCAIKAKQEACIHRKKCEKDKKESGG